MTENNNVISGLLRTAERLHDLPCVHIRTGASWSNLNWEIYSDMVCRTAAGLKQLGIKKGDRVIIFGRTRLEWTVADFAVMMIGAVSVPIYHSFKSERILSVLRSSEPVAAIVEDEKLEGELKLALQSLPWKKFPIILMEGELGTTLEKIARSSSNEDALSVRKGAEEIRPQDIATIVYTSGTTGELKGVVLSHRSLISEVCAVEEIFLFNEHQIGLLWLPLAHVLGRMMQMFCFVHGTQTAFEPDPIRLPQSYKEIHPHYVCGVPRMLEKIYEQVLAYIETSNPLKKRFLSWAIRVGARRSKAIQWKHRVPLTLKLSFALAYLVFFKKIRDGLGGELKCFICGGARLSEDIAKFFHSAGIMVLEGYGLTETFAAVTVNRFDDFRFGTVGKPVDGAEIKISNNGEILIRCPMLFSEYLNQPEETKEAFGGDGWFRTGDLGEFSRDGFLRITGRIKELIITAGGKNISPSMIETLMTDSPYINHFVVIGDARRYLAAIVTLNEPMVDAYLKSIGAEPLNGKAISNHPEVIKLIEKHVTDKNSKLASFETVKRFAILDADFAVESGELTPTMKIRRETVTKKYKHVIDSLF